MTPKVSDTAASVTGYWAGSPRPSRTFLICNIPLLHPCPETQLTEYLSYPRHVTQKGQRSAKSRVPHTTGLPDKPLKWLGFYWPKEIAVFSTGNAQNLAALLFKNKKCPHSLSTTG